MSANHRYWGTHCTLSERLHGDWSPNFRGLANDSFEVWPLSNHPQVTPISPIEAGLITEFDLGPGDDFTVHGLRHGFPIDGPVIVLRQAIQRCVQGMECDGVFVQCSGRRIEASGSDISTHDILEAGFDLNQGWVFCLP